MPGFRPIIPLLSYEGFEGSGLGLAGECFNLKKFTKALAKAEEFSLGLGGKLEGYDV